MVIMVTVTIKSWAKFMCKNKENLASAGDFVHRRPGIKHDLFDYSRDMNDLEIV